MAGLSPQNPPQTQTQTQTQNQNPNPNTLLIRHLPSAIPEATLSRLFSHYGASSVRPCPSHGRLRNCAFVDFHNETLAVQALRQLNGLRFLGKVLKVEKASKTTNQSRDENKPRSSYSEARLGSDFVRPTASTTAFSGGIVAEGVSNSRSLPAAEPIAPRLGVDYPFPPYLEYAYPSPDGNILTNIVNALIAVPRFYTQVLHLMNKMNIPAPFRMAMPTPPLPPLAPVPPPPPPPPLESTKQQLAELSSEESEMDSSDEEVDQSISTSGASRSSKRIKRDSILRPAVDKGVAHDAVRVKPATLTPKEIPVIKKRNPVLQIKIAPKADQRVHDDDSTTRETEEPKIDSLDVKPYATPEEIQNGKLALEELLSLPVFKNYKPGNPASILYIKNLAKDVIVDDFYYIFGSLFGNTDEAKSSLAVKLMQEGRMRGQAFVTFPSVELAHQALNLVNGYEFKGKPMVIQFGRNPAAAKEK